MISSPRHSVLLALQPAVESSEPLLCSSLTKACVSLSAGGQPALGNIWKLTGEMAVSLWESLSRATPPLPAWP